MRIAADEAGVAVLDNVAEANVAGLSVFEFHAAVFGLNQEDEIAPDVVVLFWTVGKTSFGIGGFEGFVSEDGAFAVADFFAHVQATETNDFFAYGRRGSSCRRGGDREDEQERKK